MATRRTKNGDEERLDPSSIEKVIAGLDPKEEGKKPITKKEACAILNIAYNTTRLDKIIKEYLEKKERTAKRRAEKRGKPVDLEEAKYIIQEYLSGEPVSSIAESSYRSTEVIKHVLDKYAVPIRNTSHDYRKPGLIPEEAMRKEFNEGDVVFAARYNSIAKIHGLFIDGKGNMVYRIWLPDPAWAQFAYQPAEELGSLEHLQKLGIKI